MQKLKDKPTHPKRQDVGILAPMALPPTSCQPLQQLASAISDFDASLKAHNEPLAKVMSAICRTQVRPTS